MTIVERIQAWLFVGKFAYEISGFLPVTEAIALAVVVVGSFVFLDLEDALRNLCGRISGLGLVLGLAICSLSAAQEIKRLNPQGNGAPKVKEIKVPTPEDVRVSKAKETDAPKAKEVKSLQGIVSTSKLGTAKDIPDAVKAATTYRIVPMTDHVEWLSRKEYLASEAKVGGFGGQLLTEFREDCEAGELDANGRYAIVWKEIQKKVETDKCQTEIPFFYASSGTAFPAIGQNKIMTVAHIFDEHISYFAEVLRIVEDQAERGLSGDLNDFLARLKSPEGAAIIQKALAEARVELKLEPHERLTPEQQTKVIKNVHTKSIKGFEDKWKKMRNNGKLAALAFLWNFPLQFWLFDHNGDVVYAPHPDGSRQANLSIVITGDILRLHADQPNMLSVHPFAKTFDTESQLYFKNKNLSPTIESMHSAIVLTVKGVNLAPPLEMETELRSSPADPVFIRGYPQRTGKEELEDGGEYIGIGKVLTAQQYYEDLGVFSQLNGESAKELLKLTGDLMLFTDAPATHGNSGGPILNASGKVVGIVNEGTTERVEDNYTFGPTCYGTLNSLNVFRELQPILQSADVQAMVPAEAKRRKP